jgi:hypothetical protein
MLKTCPSDGIGMTDFFKPHDIRSWIICEFEFRLYPIQHYVIKFVSDLWQVDGFLRALWFPPPIKLTAMI